MKYGKSNSRTHSTGFRVLDLHLSKKTFAPQPFQVVSKPKQLNNFLQCLQLDKGAFTPFFLFWASQGEHFRFRRPTVPCYGGGVAVCMYVRSSSSGQKDASLQIAKYISAIIIPKKHGQSQAVGFNNSLLFPRISISLSV